MKEYTIKKKNYFSGVWTEIEPAIIDNYKWLDNGYSPRVETRLFHDGENIYVRFQVFETKVKAVYTKMHDPVCKDSCVEFFFRPQVDPRYLNFETNAIGTLLLGLGEERNGRKEINVDPDIFDIKASVTDPEAFNGESWTLEYKIPFGFLRETYGSFNISDGIMANIYKCGDECEVEHYGTWNEVLSDKPDFHRPESFGKMTFEV